MKVKIWVDVNAEGYGFASGFWSDSGLQQGTYRCSLMEGFERFVVEADLPVSREIVEGRVIGVEKEPKP